MYYYVRRYRLGLRKIRRWLPLVLLPSVIYLVIAAASADSYSVSQSLAIQKTAPISHSRTPVDIMTMEDVALKPAALFLDDFAIMDLIKYLEQPGRGQKEDSTASRNLREVIENSMSLNMPDDAHVLLSCYGRDVEMGKLLVNYYTQRLVSRSKDGLMRSMRNLNRTGGSESNGPSPQSQPARYGTADAEPNLSRFLPAAAEGNVIVQGHRILWRSDRLLPAAVILAGSLAFMFILAGFVEWTDPSFKSERQISRYLELRVIGVMPDLEPLVQLITPIHPPLSVKTCAGCSFGNPERAGVPADAL